MSSRVISAVHVLMLAAGFLIPFTNNTILLKQYSLAIPFLMFHWTINDDTCALTVIEQFVRGEADKKKTFAGQIMNKIYILPDDLWGRIIKTAFFGLWLLVQFRLQRIF